MWPPASDILVSECPRLSVTWLNDFVTLFLHKIKNSPYFFVCVIFMRWFSFLVLTLYLMTWWCILQVDFWLLFHSLLSFSLTVRLYLPFWKFHPWETSINPFPHVCLTSQLSSCSMVQAMGCTLALLAHKTPGQLQ